MTRVGSFFASFKRGCLAFIFWLHMAVCALMNEEGRKAWALFIAWGCAVSMTAYAAVVLWMVRKNPMLAFWLGVIALLIILIVITGIMVVLGVRREIGGKVGDIVDVNIRDGSGRVEVGTNADGRVEVGIETKASPDKQGDGTAI